MRLITKEELKEWVEEWVEYWFFQNKYHPYLKTNNISCTELYDILERMPTIEAVPVVHGEWISEYDGFEWDVRCSVCGEEALIKEGGSHDHAYSRYCPNCGAKMRGEHDEADC